MVGRLAIVGLPGFGGLLAPEAPCEEGEEEGEGGEEDDEM
jgi:hypothetical protein